MVTPATRRRAGAPGVARDEGGRLGLTRAPGALRGLLVVAKAEERGLTKLTVRRPLGEGNLRHEFGADPGDTRLPRRRAERGLVGAKGPHPRGEIGQRRPGESRPDLADEPERGSIEQADEQCTEVLALSGGSREAADDEFRLLPALDLEPAPRAPAGLVGGGLVLGDDALPAALLRDAVGGEAIGRQPARAHLDAAAREPKRFEHTTAFSERPPQQRHASPLEAVEDREDGMDPFAQRPTLEELEARDAVAIEGDDLAVEHHVAVREALQGTGDLGKLRRDLPEGA